MNTLSTQCHNPVQQCTDYQSGTANRLLRNARATLKEWCRRSEVRAQLRAELLEMDIARVEKDAGLSTGELRREASKPFWRA